MRVTQRGIGLLAAAAALLAAGFLLGYPELTVVGSTAVVALGFGVCYAAWRPRLTVTRSADPDRVMRGEASRVTLRVRNASRLRGATLVAYDRCGATTVPVPLLKLRAGAETSVDYPVPTERRGVVRIGPLRVVRRDPLGLLTLPRSHGGVSQVWVYPKVHPLTAVPVGIARSLDGRVDRVPQGTITFDALREYVVGDELRHVHWRTTARVGELMVREHVDTSLPRLVVLLDDRLAAYPDAGRDRESEGFEAACEAAASIVVAAFREELPVTLHLVGGHHAGGKSAQPLLDLLAEAELWAGDGHRKRSGDASRDQAGSSSSKQTGEASSDGADEARRSGTGLGAGRGPRKQTGDTASDRAEDARRSGSSLRAGRGPRKQTGDAASDRGDDARRAGSSLRGGAGLRAGSDQRGGDDGRRDALDTTIATLRHRRQGDTLVYLTGPGGADDVGRVGTLRGAYPSIVVGTIGVTEGTPSTMDGLLVLAASDGAEFARAWDGVRAW